MLTASANRAFGERPLDAAVQIVVAAYLAWSHSIFIVGAAAIMCVMVAVSDESEPLLRQVRKICSPILCNRVAWFMSEMSYGVYLAHGIVIVLFGGWLFSQPYILGLRPVFRTTILTMVTLPASYAVAWVLNRFIEKPGIEFGRSLIAVRPKMRAQASNNLTVKGEKAGS
jgi:peptidoglycan/LPS O-acetylase OafA/YrhL